MSSRIEGQAAELTLCGVAHLCREAGKAQPSIVGAVMADSNGAVLAIGRARRRVVDAEDIALALDFESFRKEGVSSQGLERFVRSCWPTSFASAVASAAQRGVANGHQRESTAQLTEALGRFGLLF
jgi:hypothetical protein